MFTVQSFGEFSLFLFSKSCQVPDWRGIMPKTKEVFWLLVCLNGPVSGMGGGISLLQGRSCSFGPVLHVTLYHTICFRSRSSSRADCKGTEWWGCSGMGNKKTKQKKTNLLSFDLLGANLQMLWNLFILLTWVEL